jgi:hypothetical protein
MKRRIRPKFIQDATGIADILTAASPLYKVAKSARECSNRPLREESWHTNRSLTDYLEHLKPVSLQ